MNSNETDKDNDSTHKIEKTLNEKLTISEAKLMKLVEHARHQTASECFDHFQKFHKDELEFQRKIQLQDREYERRKKEEDREYEREKKEEDTKFKQGHMRNERFWRILAIILAVGGFYLLVWSGIGTEKENNRRAANEHKVDLIRQDIAEKKKILQAGTEAIGELRLIDAKVIRYCQYGHPFPQEEQDAMRREAWQKVANSFAVVAYAFDDPVVNKVKELVRFDSSIKDVCTYKGNLDDRLLQYKTEIFDLAHKSLQEDEDEINKLK